jgi:Cd2+/Zn2+-exporting ATPase
MLTGDHAASARRVAAELGITDVRADLLPAQKVDAVRGLKAAHGRVAMVGDGVNDAPALAAADVGIAMGVAGSDVALETADVALMSDELRRIPYAIRLGRATVRNIQANIALSLGLKAVFLVLAAFGLATLWMAVAADMGASLLVIANGLRLLRYD